MSTCWFFLVFSQWADCCSRSFCVAPNFLSKIRHHVSKSWDWGKQYLCPELGIASLVLGGRPLVWEAESISSAAPLGLALQLLSSSRMYHQLHNSPALPCTQVWQLEVSEGISQHSCSPFSYWPSQHTCRSKGVSVHITVPLLVADCCCLLLGTSYLSLGAWEGRAEGWILSMSCTRV